MVTTYGAHTQVPRVPSCAYVCSFPNQDIGRLQISVPTPLHERWHQHIGGDKLKKYRYDVANAVCQAGSTRATFIACWKQFVSAGKRTNVKKFWSTLFQMLRDAGFGQAGDWTHQKVEFVRQILQAKHDVTQVHYTFTDVVVTIPIGGEGGEGCGLRLIEEGGA